MAFLLECCILGDAKQLTVKFVPIPIDNADIVSEAIFQLNAGKALVLTLYVQAKRFLA
jgi:hypothetical protein